MTNARSILEAIKKRKGMNAPKAPSGYPTYDYNYDPHDTGWIAQMLEEVLDLLDDIDLPHDEGCPQSLSRCSRCSIDLLLGSQVDPSEMEEHDDKEILMRVRNKSTEWQKAVKTYLAKLGIEEYQAQKRAHLKKNRSERTFRYYPSEYHRRLVELLGDNNEEGFKALKMLEGYASQLQS